MRTRINSLRGAVANAVKEPVDVTGVGQFRDVERATGVFQLERLRPPLRSNPFPCGMLQLKHWTKTTILSMPSGDSKKAGYPVTSILQDLRYEKLFRS